MCGKVQRADDKTCRSYAFQGRSYRQFFWFPNTANFQRRLQVVRDGGSVAVCWSLASRAAETAGVRARLAARAGHAAFNDAALHQRLVLHAEAGHIHRWPPSLGDETNAHVSASPTASAASAQCCCQCGLGAAAPTFGAVTLSALGAAVGPAKFSLSRCDSNL